MDNELKTKLAGIRMIALDVDGVLTDGTINIGVTAELFKAFNAKDGLGLSAALRHGIKVVIITGRVSSIVHNRARELGLTQVSEGIKDKGRELAHLAHKYGIPLSETVFMGDDLNDLAAMAQAGLAAAPADAAAEVLEFCPFVAAHNGGRGAVRDLVEAVFQAQGRWEDIVNDYRKAGQGDKQ